jgi:hypothetical protein
MSIGTFSVMRHSPLGVEGALILGSRNVSILSARVSLGDGGERKLMIQDTQHQSLYVESANTNSR